MTRPTAKTAAYEGLMAALAAAEPSATVTSALRAWIEAQRTTDVDHLRELARHTFSAPNAFGPRYQLLLAGLMEEQNQRREALELRQAVVNGVKTDLSHLARADAQAVRDRYWLAYACAANARSAQRRGDDQGELAALREAAFYSPDVQDHARQWDYFYEQVTLGGESDYRPTYADALERAGELDGALAQRTESAILDRTALPALRTLFARVRPGESFAVYWMMAHLAGRPTAPALVLLTPDGRTVNLSSYRGRWTLIDFWATWCVPCQAEMPRVEALSREYPTHVLTLAVDDSPSVITNYLRQHHYSFLALLASTAVADTFDVTGVPFKLILAPDGRYFPLLDDSWEQDARELLSNQ